MKRTIALLLCLVLCVTLLAGCGKKTGDPAAPTEAPAQTQETEAPAQTQDGQEPETVPVDAPTEEEEPAPLPYVEPTSEREGMWDVIPFDQMPYERPDLEDLRTAIDAVGEALDAGADYETVEALLDACDDAYNAFYTMYSISFIRSCQDTTDEFYADEYAQLDEASADVSQLIENLYFRCGMSDMAQELEEKYFWPGFAEEYADDSNAFYDDEMVALLQQESNLIADYRALVANPIITLSNGKEVELATALEEYSGYAYIDMLLSYYDQYNPQLAAIYIDLIKVRQQQAAHAGYESYEALAFDHDFRRDYTPELAAEYLDNICKYIVPLYLDVQETDLAWGVSATELSAERLENALRVGVSSLGDEVLDTYEFMVKYRLCDIVHSPVKASMSFQTYLGGYEVPFLFMDATGTLDDILTFSHEFGHYLDGYQNFDADETIDLAECFSQSMELLMLTRLGDTVSEKELETLYDLKMLNILDMYVQQGSFAEFEHIVYGADPEELSVEYLNQVFLSLTQKYGYEQQTVELLDMMYGDLATQHGHEEGFEFLYSMMWMDITHFFEQPFYVITYPVSHDIAMQIFQLEEEEEGAGMEKFLEMLPREYPDMLDTALNAGLESPFDEGRLKKVADTMREILLG